MKAISAVVSGGGGSGGFRGPGGIQRSGTPPIGGGDRGKDALWQRMSGCMDQIHSVMVSVWLLQRVLSKKRDPFTHVLLLDEVIQEGDPMLTERVWEAFVNSFASQMKSATTSSFVNGIFTVGYPKLYSMIENLLERVSRETDVKGVLPAISSEGKGKMRAAIENFRTAFLAQCLKHLSDRINGVFSRGNFLSKDDITSIVMRIQEEIEAVQFDGHLTLMVLREIGKVLFLLAEKAEYQISTGPEARQITGPATPAQLKNFMICQHLQEIHTRISALLSGLTREASELLSPSLGAIYGIACDSVESLFQAMLDRLQSCILQIHDQNFGVIGMDSATDNNASPYMEELQKCILHFRSQFLSRLLPSSKTAGATGTESISTKLARGMASRVLMFFIRHASLVRPLSESGKLRMARDMAELELAVGQNLFPVEQLGAPYRALRAFRPVIFLETSQLEASPLLQDLHPSEDQIWRGIKATLDDYAVLVRSRGDKEFDPVYPVMLQIGSSISENSSQSKSTD
ncbi:Conserved oligomeric Golgi complex subunit 5 [Bienertia sinuspersici]